MSSAVPPNFPLGWSAFSVASAAAKKRSVGVVGTVTEAAADAPDRLPAASTATTLYE